MRSACSSTVRERIAAQNKLISSIADRDIIACISNQYINTGSTSDYVISCWAG
jgi:hypothetical protein